MGVSIEQWRAAIGYRYRGGSSGCHVTCHPMGDAVDTACYQALPLLLLTALLIIGGVESNPGPNDDRYGAKNTELWNENRKLTAERDQLKTKLDKQKTTWETEMREQKETFETQIEQQKNALEQYEKDKKILENQIEQLKESFEQRIEQQKVAPPDLSTSVANPVQEDDLKKYKKTKGSATMDGQFYEVKMIALIYMRLINKCQQFFLASNMDAAGLFDDVIVRTKKAGQDTWSTTLIQLKHKGKGNLDYTQLLTLKGTFGLAKYCESFMEVKDMYSSSKNDWPWVGEFEDFHFVLYTNSPLDKTSKEKDAKVDMNNLFSSNPDGSAFHFSTESKIYKIIQEIVDFKQLLNDISDRTTQLSQVEINRIIKDEVTIKILANQSKDLQSIKGKLMAQPVKKTLISAVKDLSHVQDLTSYELFFEKFYLYTGQSNEARLDSLLSAEIKRACHISDDSEVRRTLLPLLIDSVSKWWGDKNDQTGKPDRLDRDDEDAKVDETDKSDKVGKTERLDGDDKDDKVVETDKSDKVGKPDRLDGDDKDDKVVETDKTGKDAEPDRLDGDDKDNKIVETDKTGKDGEPDRLDRDDKDEKVVETDKTGKAGKAKETSKGTWLTENSDIMRSLMSSTIAQLSLSKLSELRQVGIDFEFESKKRILNSIRNNPRLNLLVKPGTNTLMACQVFQALSNNNASNYIFTGSKEMLRRKDEIIAVWQNKLCQGLVIDCDQPLSVDETNDLANQLLQTLISREDLVIVLISSEQNSLTKSLQPIVLQLPELCQWVDLTSISQNTLLKYPVIFQGHIILLSSLVGDDVELINLQLQAAASGLTKVLNSELKVGQDLESFIDYYIPRSLIKGDKVVSIQSLADVPDKVVVLIAEPGMGKTTLVSHLAQAAKLADPATWVVRVNLNNCTTYLDGLKPENINTATAIEFLTRFARSTNSDVEEMIFKNRLIFSGKIVAFIDSVDEICPFYETAVCSILKHLLETKIQTLWVTSRHVAKDSLDRVLNVGLFYFAGFSNENQKHFFKMFWKDRFSDSVGSLNALVEKVMEILQGLTIGRGLGAIPLHTRLLAEYLDEHVDHFLETGLFKLPERINIQKLFKSFVTKKLKIYSEEKRRDDVANAAVKTDMKILERSILDIHMQAALKALLSGVEFLEWVSQNELREIPFHSLEKPGLVVKVEDGLPKFIHRSFVEFFTACWISINYKTKLRPLRKSLLEPRFSEVRTFLDLEFSDNCDLHEAVIHGDMRLVQSLLSSGTNINLTDTARRTALHLSVANSGPPNNKDYVDITRKLLKYKPDITVKDELLQWRPLQYAVGARSWSVVALLLQAGGLVEDLEEAKSVIKTEVFNEFVSFLSHPDSCPVYLILLSSQHGDLGVVKYLVQECGVDVGCRGVDGSSPMHKSAKGGHIDLMHFLLDRHAPCDVVDNNNSLPLHYASSVAVAELLVKHGSSVNARNNQGDSPLALALRNTNFDLTKCLLRLGADLDSVNFPDDAPHWSDFINGSLTVDQYFAKLEQDQLVSAERKRQLDEAFDKLALEVPSAQHIQEALTGSPIHRLLLGCELGNMWLVETLLASFPQHEDKAEVVNTDVGGAYALLIASGAGRKDLVRLLLTSGAEVTVRDRLGRDALMYASDGGHEDVVRLLITSGADVRVRDSEGRDALYYARKEGHAVVEEILKTSGVEVPGLENS